MESVQFLNDGQGRFVLMYSSNIEMCILGNFLSTDVGCYDSYYREWALDPEADFGGGNLTQLEIKEDGFVYLSSCLPLQEDEKLVECKLTREQFIKILDYWEQVCKSKPVEAVIRYWNDLFIFETNNLKSIKIVQFFLKEYGRFVPGYSGDDEYERLVAWYSTNMEMCILGNFLSKDVGCSNFAYRQWAMADKLDPDSKLGWVVGGNVTFVEEKKDGFVYLSSLLPLKEGEEFIEFKLAKKQLIKILDDWEQVCILKPANVTIKYENDEFIFETK